MTDQQQLRASSRMLGDEMAGAIERLAIDPPALEAE
jgi:hypothetical protein